MILLRQMDIAQSELDLFLSARKQTESNLKQLKENYKNSVDAIASKEK